MKNLMTRRSNLQTNLIRSKRTILAAALIALLTLLSGALQLAMAAPLGPPIALPDDALDQPPGQAVVIDVLANDIDTDNDLNPASVRILDPANLSQQLTQLIVPGEGIWRVNTDTGVIVFTPCIQAGAPDVSCTALFRGDPWPIEYIVKDAAGRRSNPAIVTITIDNGASVRPLINDDQATTERNQPVRIAVLANDIDPDGSMDPASVAVVGSANNGGTAKNADGTITYTPDGGFTGPDQFSYRACNTDRPIPQCDTAQVSITVTPPGSNQQPIAINDAPPPISINQVIGIDVLANDSDPDGELDKNSVAIIASPAHGSASVTGDGSGTITYTPATGYSGTDQLTYRVCDLAADPLCDEAIVFLTILTATNQLPVALDDAAGTLASQAITIAVLANDLDPDGTLDLASLKILTPPPSGQALPDSGSIVYTPVDGFEGQATFLYEVCDTGEPPACDSATVTVTVIVTDATNEAYAFDDALYVRAGETVSGNVLTNDLDPESDGWQAPLVLDEPQEGAVDLRVDGSFNYVADPNFTGSDNWRYQVCDLGTPEACTTATVFMTVAAPNLRPIARDDAAHTLIDAAVTGNVLTNDRDPDNDALAVTVAPVVAPTAGFVILTPGGQFTYTPGFEYTGKDRFTYEVCDPGGLCATARATIDVRGLNMANAAPYAQPDRSAARPGSTINIPVLANDGDLDGVVEPASVSLITPPANGGAAVTQEGTIAYTSVAGFRGEDRLAYRVCDNGAPVLCTQTDVRIDVTAAGANTTYAFADAAWGRNGEVLSGNVLVNDVDLEGDIQRASTPPLVGPVHGQLTLNPDGTYSYTPNASFAGTDTFTYQVCDDQQPAACATAVVLLNVFPPNLGWDFGDAASYPTALNENGPRHALLAGLSLGSVVDAEANGVPDGRSLSDDMTELDDEAVIAAYPAYAGDSQYELEVAVTNSSPYPAQLAGWIDWNVNFSFDDAGERSLPALSGAGLTSNGATDDTFATANIPAGFQGVVTMTWRDFAIPAAQSPAKQVRLRLAADLPGSSAFFSLAGPGVRGPATGGAVVDSLGAIATQRVVVAYFSAQPTRNQEVLFEWATTLEQGVAGFNIMAERSGDLVPVNASMIASSVINSASTTAYQYQAVAEGDSFYLQVVMQSGETYLEGPVRLGDVPSAIWGKQLYLPQISQ